ncbi:MAG: HEAT repeat domain-containing protein, partial [Myxococcota bacterium]
HGGHHHGTTLYDEQLAVPLVVSVPELEPRRVSAPVELVDIATTVLAGLAIPRDVRMRGDDLGPVLLGGAGPPFAFADVGDARMVTDGRHKAICEDGRCRLFDLQRDPAEQRNVAAQEPQVLARLRSALAAFVRSLPEVEAMEVGGGVGWPAALAAAELGEGRGDDLLPFLSADAPALRAASARLLCETEYTRARPLLVRLAASDSDEFVRREAMLCAAMLGDEASHAALRERLGAIDPERVGADSLQDFCRRAALHLAHEGAEAVRWLVAIVGDAEASLDARLRAVEGLALAHEGSERERALDGLIEAMEAINLRAAAASALARFSSARAARALLDALRLERYAEARRAEAAALVERGDRRVVPLLRRWLGTPEPMRGGVALLSRMGATVAPPGGSCSEGSCTMDAFVVRAGARPQRLVLTTRGALRAVSDPALAVSPLYDEDRRDHTRLLAPNESIRIAFEGDGALIGFARVNPTDEPPPPPPEPFDAEGGEGEERTRAQ